MTGEDQLTNLTLSLEEQTLDQRLDSVLGPRHRPVYYAVAITILYAVIFFTSLLGNLSTCIVISRRSYMRTATNCYLFSLAVSDMLTIVIGMPPEFWTVWEQYPWPFGNVYCVMKCFISEITSYATVLTIQLFTIERWLAICYPMKSHIMVGFGRSAKLLILVWIVAITSGIPFVFYTSTIVSLFDEIFSHNLTTASKRTVAPAARLNPHNTAFNVTYALVVGAFTQVATEAAAAEADADAEVEAEADAIVRIPVPDSLICATTNFETMWQLCVVSAVVFFLVPMLIITVLYILIGISLRNSCKSLEVEMTMSETFTTQPISVTSVSAQSLCVYNSNRHLTNHYMFTKQTPSASRRTSADGTTTTERSKRTLPLTDRKTALRILVTVILVFFVSYAPYHCQRIIGKFAENIIQMTYGKAFLDYLFYVSGILYYVSATINPLLYNVVSKRYRRAFVYTFHEVFGRRRRSRRPFSSTSQVATFRPSHAIVSRGSSICADLKLQDDEDHSAGNGGPDDLEKSVNLKIDRARATYMHSLPPRLQQSSSANNLIITANGACYKKSSSTATRNLNACSMYQLSSAARQRSTTSYSAPSGKNPIISNNVNNVKRKNATHCMRSINEDITCFS